MQIFIKQNKPSDDKTFGLKHISDNYTFGHDFVRRLDRSKVFGFNVQELSLQDKQEENANVIYHYPNLQCIDIFKNLITLKCQINGVLIHRGGRKNREIQ